MLEWNISKKRFAYISVLKKKKKEMVQIRRIMESLTFILKCLIQLVDYKYVVRYDILL
jgi:hypothetical protein